MNYVNRKIGADIAFDVGFASFSSSQFPRLVPSSIFPAAFFNTISSDLYF